jgi:hypothetical protein
VNWMPRIRSYVVRADGQIVFDLSCGHRRTPNLTPLAEKRQPQEWLGVRFPCNAPGCDGTERDLPEPEPENAA